MSRKPKDIVAFGDFQTPDALAREVTQLIVRLGVAPRGIIEPTCGIGAFLTAAAKAFPAARLVGAEANAAYVDKARALKTAEIHQLDFFTADWPQVLHDLPEPWLILGNPPWVTVAGLTQIGSVNAPARSNTAKWRGIEALTGRSNFDISEWMIGEYLRWLTGRPGAIAVLCKATVARKVLTSAWKNCEPIARARLFTIDATAHFGVAVDACLLLIETADSVGAPVCEVYPSLDASAPASRFGLVDDVVVADVAAFEAHRGLRCSGPSDDWRSGIKHDCAAVMELTRDGDGYLNGFGERVILEPDYLYPLLKSSDLARGRVATNRVMLVPQRGTGDDTARLAHEAPATWAYLNRHAARLADRKSAIYRHRPPFAIFGVGPYTFAPWKVAISGLYKRLAFTCVGPVDGRAVVFDDTVTFLACANEAQARSTCDLLATADARAFLESMIFWSDKRPITTALLRRLSLRALADVGGEFDLLAERQRA